MTANAVLGALTTIGLLASAGTLRAQSTLDTTIAVRGTTRLVVSNHSGDVTIRQWGRNQIRVQADIENRGGRVEVDASAGRVSVRTVVARGRGEVSYTITVPQGTPIEITGISVDVQVNQVCGELQLNTTSGDVNVACTTGAAFIQTVSGDISVADARGDLDIGATSGDIQVRGARGNVSARTVSGDVDLFDVQGSDVTAESVSGDIRYSGLVRDNGRYRLVTHSGDVELRARGNINATVSVSTFSGEFVPEFAVELAPGPRMGRELQVRLGTGSARIRLESFSGSIYLKRGSEGPRED
jgi:DUF4097 and DUF4098 domain-containing protein YvlB